MTQAAFSGTAPTGPTTNLDSGDDWCEYAASDMQSGLDLVEIGRGRVARMVVLKESGNLYAVNALGEERTLTGLPAGYIHTGKVRAIQPGQRASIIVYW